MAVIWGILVVDAVHNPRDTISSYTDYKILLKYFDQNYENIGEIPWNLIEKDCKKYHQKKHTSTLFLGEYDPMGVFFIDPTTQISKFSAKYSTKFLASKLERYTQYAYEGLSPTLDEAFIPEHLFKEIYEFSGKTSTVNTEWKNISVNNRCYHLLEKISGVYHNHYIPHSINEEENSFPRLLKKQDGQ